MKCWNVLRPLLGEKYKKQSMTELVATFQYGDSDGKRKTYK